MDWDQGGPSEENMKARTSPKVCDEYPRRKRSGMKKQKRNDENCVGEDEARELRDKVDHLTMSVLRRCFERN